MIEDSSLSCGEGLSLRLPQHAVLAGRTVAAADAEQSAGVFEQLFGDGADDAQRAARRAQALSLLDSVAEQMQGPRPRAAGRRPRSVWTVS